MRGKHSGRISEKSDRSEIGNGEGGMRGNGLRGMNKRDWKGGWGICGEGSDSWF